MNQDDKGRRSQQPGEQAGKQSQPQQQSGGSRQQGDMAKKDQKPKNKR